MAPTRVRHISFLTFWMKYGYTRETPSACFNLCKLLLVIHLMNMSVKCESSIQNLYI